MASHIITSIDIGTSKISMLVCNVSSSDNIEILGMGTSVLKGVQRGIIQDSRQFSNAFQNCLKRAELTSQETISDVFINVPNGNKRFIIETGIHQNHDNQTFSKKAIESAMKKATHCIEKKNQSILHLLPIGQRVDGRPIQQNIKSAFTHLEIDTGIICCDSTNLNTVIQQTKIHDLKIKGIISDYLSLGAIASKIKSTNVLIVDFGAQLTSFCLFNRGQLKFAKTIHIGSELITNDLSICLKCSFSEAERIKIIHGQLKNVGTQYNTNVLIQCHDGEKSVSITMISSIIESRMNQLFQIISKYLNQAPSFDELILLGCGSNLRGYSTWMEEKFTVKMNTYLSEFYKDANINLNFSIAMGQIIHGYQMGLLNTNKSGLFRHFKKPFFKSKQLS